MVLDKMRGLCVLATVITALGTVACAAPHVDRPTNARPSGPTVVVTTTTLASLVKTVAAGHAQVVNLVPLGASPETYEPRPQDLVAVAHATLVVQNGAGLEAWLSKILSNSVGKGAKLLTLSDGLPPTAMPPGTRYSNPHFWLDPIWAQVYVRETAAALSEIDSRNSAEYQRNALAEVVALQKLHLWIKGRLASLPPADRAMITFHDAWFYFDRRYGIRDLGSIVSSPGKEPSAAQFAALIDKARSEHVHAIFGEPEYSPKLVQQLADSAHIRIVANLYDDSLGTTPALSSYEGIMRYDVDTIVAALHG